MVITVSKKLEDTTQLVFELVFDPSAMESVDHDAAFVKSTPHTSLFSCSENALIVAHHTAWLKNVLVCAMSSAWSPICAT